MPILVPILTGTIWLRYRVRKLTLTAEPLIVRQHNETLRSPNRAKIHNLAKVFPHLEKTLLFINTDLVEALVTVFTSFILSTKSPKVPRLLQNPKGRCGAPISRIPHVSFVLTSYRTVSLKLVVSVSPPMVLQTNPPPLPVSRVGTSLYITPT